LRTLATRFPKPAREEERKKGHSVAGSREPSPDRWMDGKLAVGTTRSQT
jgi:hypothetical protein